MGAFMKVYLVWHEHGDDEKLIGVFSNRGTAEAAVATYLEKPGFKDVPEGFVIDEYEVDRPSWEEGFVTV